MEQDGTLSLDEVARFDALAQDWWAPDGPMAPLHRMNPLRAAWITQRLPKDLASEILDVGCGAGLLAEALAKGGVSVLGLDAAEAAIAAARIHAEGQNLPLRYRAGRIEDLIAEGTRFPVVTALEVIEHVPDPQAFLQALSDALEPEGLLFLSTLNRSLRSLLTAKIGAEYVLRLLPAGTHTWRQFIPPARLATMAANAGLQVTASAGLSFDPWRSRWKESRDLSINYIMALRKG